MRQHLLGYAVDCFCYARHRLANLKDMYYMIGENIGFIADAVIKNLPFSQKNSRAVSGVGIEQIENTVGKVCPCVFSICSMPTQKGIGFMARNLTQQLNYAICSSLRIGESKHQYKSDHNGEVDGRIYAVQSAENLRATANSFGKFMKAHHPEIRMVRDITNVHLQEYINASSKKWTQKTTDSKVSDLRRIMDRAERRFGSLGCRPSEIVAPKVAIYSKRDTAMSRTDLEKLRDSFMNRSSKSEGLTALEVASRSGLRIKEIARLETKNIDLEKGFIRVREGGKNGKFRDVPIRERDRAYFAEIKVSRGKERFLCRGVSEDGLNRAIRREMKACGLDGKYNTTTNHAVRKLYATERMKEEMERGCSEKEAWRIVQMELGHGAVFREKLFNTYVK